MQYIKQRGLLKEAQRASFSLKKVFTECLKPDYEDIMIITDFGREASRLSSVLGAGYLLAARSLGLEPTITAQKQKRKGDRAESRVQAMLGESGFENIIIMVSDFLGSSPRIGNSFRKFVHARRHKFISCTGLSSLETSSLQSVLDAIDIDYHSLRKKAHFLKEALDRGSELQVTTPAGTDLWLKIKGKEACPNDGHYAFPGKGGNIPAGEVYIPPRKKKAEGRIVVDGSSRSLRGTSIAREPIKITVNGGEVTEIKGGEEARLLEKSIEWAHENSKYPWGIRRLSEFGIGINPKARIIGATIVDEKTPNTAHVAVGSNHWFGGTVYAKIHLDQIFKNPEIRIDGELLDKSLYTY